MLTKDSLIKNVMDLKTVYCLLQLNELENEASQLENIASILQHKFGLEIIISKKKNLGDSNK